MLGGAWVLVLSLLRWQDSLPPVGPVSTDFKDLDAVPDKVSKTAAMVAGNAAHLAGLLKARPYPGQ